MEEFQSQKIKSAIKILLKRKKLKYEDLAQELECSLPTVKRILGAEELTLSRLLQVCRFLNITLSDLETLSQDESQPSATFTKEQEEFLASHKNYFAYLMKLYSGETPKRIAEQHKLSQRSTDKYLIKLERLGLIRVTGKQTVKTSFKSVPKLKAGPLAKVHFESLITSAGQFFIDSIHRTLMGSAQSDPRAGSPQSKFGVQRVKVTRATYDAWLEENEKSLRNFEKLGSFEEKTKDESELMTAVVVQAAALVAHDEPSLGKIENSLGEITDHP